MHLQLWLQNIDRLYIETEEFFYGISYPWNKVVVKYAEDCVDHLG